MDYAKWLEKQGAHPEDYPDDEQSLLFIANAMKSYDMSLSDVDDYAWLNTLIGYDIGAERAQAIIRYLYESVDLSVQDLGADDKMTVNHAIKELGFHINMDNWTKGEPKAIRYDWAQTPAKKTPEKKVCLSLAELYSKRLGGYLEHGTITCYSEGENEYFDLYNSDGELVCMDGEEATVVKETADAITLSRNGTEFVLSRDEYRIAVFTNEDTESKEQPEVRYYKGYSRLDTGHRAVFIVYSRPQEDRLFDGTAHAVEAEFIDCPAIIKYDSTRTCRKYFHNTKEISREEHRAYTQIRQLLRRERWRALLADIHG